MRHGKPLITKTDWIAPVEMEQWIDHYNLSEVDVDGMPSDSLKLANTASCIVVSTAPRALSSVYALGHAATVVDSVFCEAQLPFTLWRFPRMSPFVWVACFRLLWFLGYSQNSESIQIAKIRAKTAAHKLISLAEKGPVLLVGHGIMNYLIAKELIALGWDSFTRQESKYWGAGVYEFRTKPI